jgi:DNA-binding IscR family transcriptional regulator
LHYTGSAEPLARVWIALRSNVRDVLEQVTLADIVADELPPAVVSILGASEPA